MAEMVYLFHLSPEEYWKLDQDELAAFIRKRDQIANR